MTEQRSNHFVIDWIILVFYVSAAVFILQSTNVHTIIYLRCLIFLWPTIHTTHNVSMVCIYFFSPFYHFYRHVYCLYLGEVIIKIINSVRQMFGSVLPINRIVESNYRKLIFNFNRIIFVHVDQSTRKSYSFRTETVFVCNWNIALFRGFSGPHNIFM